MKDMLTGVGIAAAMMGLIFTIAYFQKWISVMSLSWETDGISMAVGQTFIWFLIFVLVGWQEELLSRGYHLQNLADGINRIWGVILSSLIFAFLHMINPGATWISTIGIFLAGLFLSLGYVLTKQLWLPIGLHFGWNWVLPLFGVNLSGFTMGLSGYTLRSSAGR